MTPMTSASRTRNDGGGQLPVVAREHQQGPIHTEVRPGGVLKEREREQERGRHRLARLVNDRAVEPSQIVVVHLLQKGLSNP